MAWRDRIRVWLGIDGRIRDLIRNELAARSYPQASEVAELRQRVTDLEKKLKMTMGAMQASSAQLMGLHDAVDKVRASAAQAGQAATTARATAESTADGLEGVEEQLAALQTNLAASARPAPKRASKTRRASKSTAKSRKASED